jgi:2-aminoethylphosphonate transport system ATP-binding protein
VNETSGAVPRDGGESPQIRVQALSVRYGDHAVLDRIDLSVAAGEVVVLLGASGSGKTTLLRAIAGFTAPTGGRIALGTTDVTGAPPYARGLGLVVQNYALFPHLRVADNVAFGLRARKLPRAHIERTVARFLEMTGMAAYAQRYPRELSGGQQQRVAIARALAIEPPALLLDEPLSALDAPLRAEMLEELRRLHAQLPKTAIVYVTHDQTEAIAIGHRIVLLHQGRIVADGAPRNLHDSPPNRYTAEFFGQANLLPARILDPPPGADAPRGCVAVRIADRTIWARRSADAPPGGEALLCVRSHDLGLDMDSTAAFDGNRLDGVVRSSQWLGALQRAVVDVGPATVRVDRPANAPLPAPGARVQVTFAAERAVLLADR